MKRKRQQNDHQKTRRERGRREKHRERENDKYHQKTTGMSDKGKGERAKKRKEIFTPGV